MSWSFGGGFEKGWVIHGETSHRPTGVHGSNLSVQDGLVSGDLSWAAPPDIEYCDVYGGGALAYLGRAYSVRLQFGYCWCA